MSKLVDKKINIEVFGTVYVAPVICFQQKRLVEEFKARGITLPTLVIRKRNAYRILRDPIIVKETFEGVSEWHYFGAGFMWDLSSVPSALKMLIDNDDPASYVPSMLHDKRFGLHGKSFRETNKRYYWGCRFFGMNVARGILSWSGVASIIGRIKWKRLPASRQYMKRFTYTSSEVINL